MSYYEVQHFLQRMMLAGILGAPWFAFGPPVFSRFVSSLLD